MASTGHLSVRQSVGLYGRRAVGKSSQTKAGPGVDVCHGAL